MYKIICGCIFFTSTDAVSFHRSFADNSTATKKSITVDNTAKQVPGSFEGFYNQHTQGRGIWKWNNALAAYQRHFSSLAGAPLAVAEVGVQSGGSLLMWQSALGNQITLYGLDINPACKKFEGPSVSITLGDQASPQMWQQFFQTQVQQLDILVDDGGHEPQQMLTTVYEPFPHIKPGGWLVIEDIHGPGYLQSFFSPVANYLAQQATTGAVDSVHVYPFLLMIHKGGVGQMSAPPAPGAQTVVGDMNAMWAAVTSSTTGGVVVLKQPAWGSFLTASALINFFTYFNGLHGSQFVDNPPGCRTTAAAVCTNAIMNEVTQNFVYGIHIYHDRLEVEVPNPTSPPVIEAVRKGSEWIGYGF